MPQLIKAAKKSGWKPKVLPKKGMSWIYPAQLKSFEHFLTTWMTKFDIVIIINIIIIIIIIIIVIIIIIIITLLINVN